MGDGRSLYVRGGAGEKVSVHCVDLETGQRVPWRELAPDPSGGAAVLPLAMTPDANWYAYTTFQYASELYLVKGLV